MRIPLWSDLNPSAKEILSPTESEEWDNLAEEDKQKIWRYLEYHLFNPAEGSSDEYSFVGIDCNYKFYGDDNWENSHLLKNVSESIAVLNYRHKRHSYARNFLRTSKYDDACQDFYKIFTSLPKDVVFELLTIFSNTMVTREVETISKKQDETDKDFEKRKEVEIWKRFDSFSEDLNEVLQQFGINYQLTRNGIVPADEPAVVEKIYKPALKKLSSKKWAEVNRDLRDAFDALNKDKDGSGALTHALAALQAFLQIQVHGKTGKGDTAKLINEAISRKLIPDDDFSKKIIKDINSFWAKERKDKGDPHPKKAYATKGQAKLIISLIMVFIDHSL